MNRHLIDTVLHIGGFKNDAALSAASGVSPPSISKIRNQKHPATPEVMVKFQDITGLSISVMRALVGLPDYVKLSKADMDNAAKMICGDFAKARAYDSLMTKLALVKDASTGIYKEPEGWHFQFNGLPRPCEVNREWKHKDVVNEFTRLMNNVS